MQKAIELLTHPVELAAMLRVRREWADADRATTGGTYSFERCYHYLRLTSRSFARVIQLLDPELRHAVRVFYLVLRGLDTVEDDMSLAPERKAALLAGFRDAIHTRGWTCSEIGPDEKDRALLEEFNVVVDEFLGLDAAYREVIADVTAAMAEGMQRYQTAGVRIDTVPEYNLYTHYVAGLVGLGLTRLFVASGLEPALADVPKPRLNRLANAMGLFLQKANIIKDAAEDWQEGRCFWPKEVWAPFAAGLLPDDAPLPRADSKHALADDERRSWGPGVRYPSTADLDDAGAYAGVSKGAAVQLAAVPDAALGALLRTDAPARACVHALIADALTLVPDCLEYLSLLRNASVRRFCALPQLMALATLAHFLDNPRAGVVAGVRIRRGTTAWLALQSPDWRLVLDAYRGQLEILQAKDQRRARALNGFGAVPWVEAARQAQFSCAVSLGQARQAVARYSGSKPVAAPADPSRRRLVLLLVGLVLGYVTAMSFLPVVAVLRSSVM